MSDDCPHCEIWRVLDAHDPALALPALANVLADRFAALPPDRLAGAMMAFNLQVQDFVLAHRAGRAPERRAGVVLQ